MTPNTRTNLAATLLRIALAASYLSAVADRFGFWGQPGTGSVAWGNFENFLAYTATLNWFAPPALIPVLGWTATIAEVLIAIALLTGFYLTTGPEPPLSYSVWTATTASLLLTTLQNNKPPNTPTLKATP